MNEERNNLEQQNYSNQEVKQQLRDIKNQQARAGAEGAINVLKKIPATKMGGEVADKINKSTGGRAGQVAGNIAGLTPEGRFLNRAASNPNARRALNAMNFNKGGGNNSTPSSSIPNKKTDVGGEQTNNKDVIDRNKASKPSKDKTKDNKKIETNTKESEKDDSTLEKEKKEYQQNEFDSQSIDEEVKKEEKKRATKDFVVTLFGGTPTMIALISIFISILLFVILFVLFYVSIKEKKEVMTTLTASDITSAETQAIIRTPIIDPISNLYIYNITKTIQNIANNYDKIVMYRERFGNIFQNILNLGNIFSNQSGSCEGEQCETRAEVQFYQKISDITYRYKKLYDIELDWPLITATIMVNSSNKDETFAANLSDYTESEVLDEENIMSLDWEYDYKNIPGYDYLSGNDSRFDLQLLAKNMVKKTVTQTCKDAKGIDLVEPLILYDIEDALIDPKLKNGYYLECKNGTYDIEPPKYEIDKDKYDEFLNEYLEMKYYVNKNGGHGNSSGGNSGGNGDGPGPASSYGTADFGWPLPEGYTKVNSWYGPRNLNGKKFHYGIDLAAARGTPVYAVADGFVYRYKNGCVEGDRGCGDECGNNIGIDHGNGIHSVYMHGSQIVVNKGDYVKRGQLIMYSGNTGASNGPHLHFSIENHNIGKCYDEAHCSQKANRYDDPAPYLGLK